MTAARRTIHSHPTQKPAPEPSGVPVDDRDRFDDGASERSERDVAGTPMEQDPRLLATKVQQLQMASLRGS